jgi:hypothetical protein
MTDTTRSVSTDSRYHVLTCASAEALGITGEHDLDDAEIAAEAESSHGTREAAYLAARERGGDCYVVDAEGSAHYIAAVAPVVYRLVRDQRHPSASLGRGPNTPVQPAKERTDYD